MIQPEEIRSILRETWILTLSTVDEDGSPRATPLYYALDGKDQIIFLSDPDSQHSRNIAREPRSAISIHPELRGWRQIRGLQMKGTATRIHASRRDSAFSRYAERFAFISSLNEATRRGVFFRFRPSWIRLIDNRRGFGFHKEWQADED